MTRLGGKVRTCDARCHEARGDRCECWCGGVFHGARGAAARDAFREAFLELPTTEDDAAELLEQANLFTAEPARDAWRQRLSIARLGQLMNGGTT